MWIFERFPRYGTGNGGPVHAEVVCGVRYRTGIRQKRIGHVCFLTWELNVERADFSTGPVREHVHDARSHIVRPFGQRPAFMFSIKHNLRTVILTRKSQIQRGNVLMGGEAAFQGRSDCRLVCSERDRSFP